MEYTIQKLADLSGVTTRALRHYDQIGLLKPRRINTSGYRVYGQKEVDLLQQILIYKQMGLNLSQIKAAVYAADSNRVETLRVHLEQLLTERERLDLLIQTVQKTIQYEKGEINMSNQEKFEGFKKELIRKNEEQFGEEIRAAYGEEQVEASNAKMMGITEAEYEQMQAIEMELKERLYKAVKEREVPAGETGRKICELHKKWLTFTWPQYSAEAHKGVVQMYVADERFKAYYDEQLEGCAEFLKAAVEENL